MHPLQPHIHLLSVFSANACLLSPIVVPCIDGGKGPPPVDASDESANTKFLLPHAVTSDTQHTTPTLHSLKSMFEATRKRTTMLLR